MFRPLIPLSGFSARGHVLRGNPQIDAFPINTYNECPLSERAMITSSILGVIRDPPGN